MMKTWSTLLLALVVSGGCTAADSCVSWEEGDVAYVYINDPNGKFTQDKLDIIDDSLDEWSMALDGYITFEYTDNPDSENLIVINTDTTVNIRENCGTTGSTEFDLLELGGTVWLPYDLSGKRLEFLARHEIGHAIGLTHDEAGTIMMGDGDLASSHITCNDVEQFCDLHSCDASKMTICQYTH